MATKTGGYHIKDGTRVPSVTTVIGKFKDSGGLVHWAWKLGTEGKDYRVVRDNAAFAGTMAHEAVEAWIHKTNFAFQGEPDICKKAKQAFEAFLDWANQTKLEVTHTEMALVSEAHKYAGTFDAVAMLGKRAMLDWKSSARIYPEYLVQVAAYGQLWDENFPNDPITGGFDLLRFDKEFGDFHHHHWNELDQAWQAFLHLRALFEIEKELKKRAA